MEQYNQQQQGMPMMMSPDSRADVMDKIQPDRVVEQIRMRLLGKIEFNGEWISQPFMKNRALSEVGAWEISLLMLPASSQNTAMTKLDSGQIRSRLLNLAKTAQCMCLRNWKEYNIRGIDQLKFVHEIVFTNTLASLNQPLGEGMRKFVGNIASGDVGYAEQEQGGFNMFRQQ